MQDPGSRDLYEDRKRRGALSAKRNTARHCVDGGYVTYEAMAERLNVSKDAAKKRFLTARKQPGPVTWARLKGEEA